MKTPIKYSAHGVWKVTTEGDCEGRTTSHLGTHEGYIDDIAFALADKCYYSLQFERVDPKELDQKPKRDVTNVSLGIDSGSWDLHGDALVAYWEELLKGRDVTVVGHKYYAGVEIARGRDNDIVRKRQAEKLKQEREDALRKLTTREKAILGIKT
jgi:hypothetical protein